MALPGRWRAEAPAGGEDERRRQHERPEAKPQTPAPAEHTPPTPGGNRGVCFFPRWYFFGFKRYDFFAIKFGVKEVNTLKLGMGGSLTLIMLSLTPPAVTTTIKVKEAS